MAYRFGREDQLDNDVVRRLVASLSRLLDPGDALAATADTRVPQQVGTAGADQGNNSSWAHAQTPTLKHSRSSEQIKQGHCAYKLRNSGPCSGDYQPRSGRNHATATGDQRLRGDGPNDQGNLTQGDPQSMLHGARSDATNSHGCPSAPSAPAARPVLVSRRARRWGSWRSPV